MSSIVDQASTKEVDTLLRPAALWAADCACLALPVFEGKVPGENRPRQAIAGAREFGNGGRRNVELRRLAWAAHTAATQCDIVGAKYAARSAMLAASLPFTHTSLRLGPQGVRQGRHVLGPAVYAALACEIDSENPSGIADSVLNLAMSIVSESVVCLLQHFPLQPQGRTRLAELFHQLDGALRKVS